jgi:hypothetical protein
MRHFKRSLVQSRKPLFEPKKILNNIMAPIEVVNVDEKVQE